MKISVFSTNKLGVREEYSANVNRTYILVYMINNASGGRIFQEEVKGFYTFIVNRDFKMLYSGNPNMQINVIDKEKYFFVKISFINRMKLYFFHKRLWIQREENIRWLLNMIIITIATVLAFKNN